jgi:hypothetical protein
MTRWKRYAVLGPWSQAGNYVAKKYIMVDDDYGMMTTLGDINHGGVVNDVNGKYPQTGHYQL